MVGLGSKFLGNGSQSSLSGSPRNLHTSLVWCQALKPTFDNFFTLPLKIGGKKQISPTFRRPAVNRKRIMSKRLNISTNKNISFIYDSLNAPKRYQTWGLIRLLDNSRNGYSNSRIANSRVRVLSSLRVGNPRVGACASCPVSYPSLTVFWRNIWRQELIRR